MNMKITYSPFFDRGSWSSIGKGEVHLGQTAVGTKGLLSELELRAGMARPDVDSFDRTVAYYKAIKKVIKAGSKPFYHESFQKDELGVASELLRWRDALVMNGWTPSIAGTEENAYKFRDLAEIEKHFNFPGDADRWQALRETSGELAGCEVEVMVSEDVLEKVITDVLNASGADVHYAAKENSQALEISAGISVLEFRNRVEAYRWASGQAFGEGTVVVNSDNKAFNDVLRGMGRPLVNSEYTDSNPMTIQLFKLGFGLFSEVVDVNTLVAFLNIPGPISHDGRKAILDQLTKNGGFGRNWQQLLSENEVTSYPLTVAPAPPSEIARESILSFSNELRTWAKSYSTMLAAEKKDSVLISHLKALSGMCKALETVLTTTEGNVSYDTLYRWVDGIYSACSFPGDKAQLGSVDVVTDIRSFVDGPDRLVWLDCNVAPDRKYPLYFLSAAEIEYLRSNGLTIVGEEDFVKVSSSATRKSLGMVRKSITLVAVRKAYGTRSDENPIFTEIKAKKIPYEICNNPSMPEGSSIPVSKIEPPLLEHVLEEGIELPEREHGESFSSLDTLIQRPIDYVLDYILGLRVHDFGQIADIRTVKGNVAHAVIEHLVGLCREQNRSTFTDGEILSAIDEAAEYGGLLLKGNRLEFDSFKLKLTQSVKTLFGEIKRQGLKVFDSEHYVEVILPESEDGRTIGLFNARIDLLATDSEDNFVIIDLKWSESKRYRKKIATQTDLQLVLYRAALEQKYPDRKVLGCGYYVIPQYKLETRDEYFSGWSCAKITSPEESVDVYGRAVRSYFFRKEQLRNGILEGAELQDLGLLEYTRAIDDGEDLYPLDTDYRKEQLKAEAYEGKNYILKERAI